MIIRGEKTICVTAILVVLVAVGLLVAAGASAETRTWDGSAGSSDWYAPANWDPDGGPDPADDLTVSDGSPETTDYVEVANGGAVTIIGDTASGTFGDLFMAYEGTGALTISDGATLSNAVGYVAYKTGTDGVVVVDGLGSSWTSGATLYLGNLGTGELTISNGGAVSYTAFNVAAGDGSEGSVSVEGAGSTLTASAGSSIGSRGLGELTISNGGTVSGTSWGVGGVWAAKGIVTVDGPTSTWNCTGSLSIGTEARGEMHIRNGARVSCSYGHIGQLYGRGHGAVTVNGTGSTWTATNGMAIGDHGWGSMTIANGAGVISGPSFIENGNVVVDGPGSTWTVNGWLHVIDFAGSEVARLTISNGGVVTNTDGAISKYGASGYVTVTGAGSTWTNSDNLYVGYHRYGELVIAEGGTVTNVNCYIGGYNSTYGVGNVIVEGAGSTWTHSGFLCVGRRGTTAMVIRDGATVSSASGFMSEHDPGRTTMTITGANSRWTNTGSLYVGGSPTVAAGVASLTLRDHGMLDVGETLRLWGPGTVELAGGIIVAAAVDHTHGGTFSFTGGTLRTGTFSGDLVNSGGTLAPGSSTGLTTVEGNYVQESAGTLEIEIGGTGSGQYDVLVVTGTAAMAGTLDVMLIDEFSPRGGDAFNILDWSDVTGAFDTIKLPDLGSLTWNTSCLYTTGEFSVVPEPATISLLALGGLAMLRRRRK